MPHRQVEDAALAASMVPGFWQTDTCTIAAHWLSPRIIELRWQGHVTKAACELYLPTLDAMLERARHRVSLLFDLTQLETFQMGVLNVHAHFALQHLHKLDKIAAASAQAAHRFGVAAVNTMQPLVLQHFGTPQEALQWLNFCAN